MDGTFIVEHRLNTPNMFTNTLEKRHPMILVAKWNEEYPDNPVR
jgi:hypothetical protein